MLDTTIMGLALEHPVMPAAGTAKTVDAARKTIPTLTPLVKLGSITPNGGTGNPGNTYHYEPGTGYSMNAMGMPNEGIDHVAKELPELVREAHDAGKPIIVSVAAFNADDFGMMIERVLEAGADGVEINGGCPNTGHAILSFTLEGLEETLERATRRAGADARASLKLSPYSDPGFIPKVAEIIVGFPLVKAVVTSNTFPKAFDCDQDGKAHIEAMDGLAGLGGAVMRPIGLGQVKQFRAVLPQHVEVIGVGGISRAEHVREYLATGARAVQIATALINRGPSLWFEILDRF